MTYLGGPGCQLSINVAATVGYLSVDYFTVGLFTCVTAFIVDM